MRPARRISLLRPLRLAVVLIAFSAAITLAADLPSIVVELPDTAVPAGGNLGWLTVRLGNFSDTVAGVQLQLRLDRPDLVHFDLTGADFDTAGTLLSGYEMVLARDTAVDHGKYLLLGLANQPQVGTNYLGFPPQPGDALIRIPFRTAIDPNPDSGLVCNIEILPPTVFSDPSGHVIGYHVTDTVIDSLFYKCTLWQGESCLSWAMVDPEISTYDSIYEYEYYVEEPDPTKLILGSGKLTVVPSNVATCDHNADGTYSVTDLTCLVNHLFRTAGPGCPAMLCDCDASGNDPAAPNVADLTCMVAFLFRGGHPPGQ